MFSQVCVKNSVHRGGVSVPACTTGHMTRGSLSRGVSTQGGLCQGRVSVRKTPRQRDPLGQGPARTVESGQYASHWNAFLLEMPTY